MDSTLLVMDWPYAPWIGPYALAIPAYATLRVIKAWIFDKKLSRWCCPYIQFHTWAKFAQENLNFAWCENNICVSFNFPICFVSFHVHAGARLQGEVSTLLRSEHPGWTRASKNCMSCEKWTIHFGLSLTLCLSVSLFLCLPVSLSPCLFQVHLHQLSRFILLL